MRSSADGPYKAYQTWKTILHAGAGIQSRLASTQQAEARAATAIPYQAVLHFQHAHHSAVSIGLQSVLHFTAIVQALWALLSCQAVGPLGGEPVT